MPCELNAPEREQTPNPPLESKLAIRLTLIESKLQELLSLNTYVPDLVRLLRELRSSRTDYYGPRSREGLPLAESSDSPTTATSSSGEPCAQIPLPPGDLVDSACNAYFKWFHNQPFTYFEESKFRQDLQDRRIADYLLFALIATVAKNPRDDTFKNLPVDTWRNYAEQSWLLLVASGGGPSFDRDDCIAPAMIQALLLLAMIDSEDGRQRAVWLKIGLAVRISQDLQLHLEPPVNMPPTHREERRSLFWSVYMIDRYVSCTRQKFPVIQDGECLVRLPGNSKPPGDDSHDERGALLSQLITPLKEKSLEPNQYSLLVLMTSIMGSTARYMLNDYHMSSQEAPWDRHSQYLSICTNLLYFESLTNTRAPLRQILGSQMFLSNGRINQPKAGHTIFTHLIFHFCHCLLSHPFLLRRKVDSTRLNVPTTWMMNALKSGLEHARLLSLLVREAEDCGFAIQASFHAYFLLIAGSIHALYSNSSDADLKQEAKRHFLWDLESLEGAGKHFPRTVLVARELKLFAESAHKFSDLLDIPTSKYEPDESFARVLWTMVDYVAMVCSSASPSSMQLLSSKITSMASATWQGDFIRPPSPLDNVPPERNSLFAPLRSSMSPEALEKVVNSTVNDLDGYQFSLPDDQLDFFNDSGELLGLPNDQYGLITL
ncbi:hypothetical protein LTS17_005398 [Exophiala oligosperma]